MRNIDPFRYRKPVERESHNTAYVTQKSSKIPLPFYDDLVKNYYDSYVNRRKRHGGGITKRVSYNLPSTPGFTPETSMTNVNHTPLDVDKMNTWNQAQQLISLGMNVQDALDRVATQKKIWEVQSKPTFGSQLADTDKWKAQQLLGRSYGAIDYTPQQLEYLEQKRGKETLGALNMAIQAPLWALDPVGMALFEGVNAAPAFFDTQGRGTFTQLQEDYDVNPLVAGLFVGGAGGGIRGLNRAVGKGVKSASRLARGNMDALRFNADPVNKASGARMPYTWEKFTTNKPVYENVVYKPNQMKLADAVTRDDAGNIIPLSQRDNFGLNDIRYQQSTSTTAGNNPWTQEDAQEAANWATTFFINDVQPRLLKTRPWLQGSRFTENSPLLGRFNFGEMPTKTARGMTSPIIRRTKNGAPYVTTMNANDMSSLNDKIGGLIHEMRHDMTNFHSGKYNEQIQYIMKKEQMVIKNFEDAKANGDYDLVELYQNTLQQYQRLHKELKQRGYISDALTSEENALLNKAYRTPQNPKFKDSHIIEEKSSENTRFRSEVSRRNGNIMGEELDKVIDKMSDDEVMDILKTGDSYGIDYAQYIEENPQGKSQMIRNIKQAWKKVGVVAGVATGLEGTIIQGRLVEKQ